MDNNDLRNDVSKAVTLSAITSGVATVTDIMSSLRDSLDGYVATFGDENAYIPFFDDILASLQTLYDAMADDTFYTVYSVIEG